MSLTCVNRGGATTLALLLLTTAAQAEDAAPPTACLADTRADAIARLEEPGPSPIMERAPFPDLDGDGVAEHAWVPVYSCGASGNCTQHLYLSGAGCPVYAGVLYGVQVEVMPGPPGNPPDLWTFLRTGCAGAEGTVALLRFIDGRYRLVADQHCPCPTGERPPPATCLLREDGGPEALQAAAAWAASVPTPTTERTP
jgi:hypothetical protein